MEAKRKEKLVQYVSLISSQIEDMVNNDECDNYVDLSDKNFDATLFFYAIELAAGSIYKELTGDDVDVLGFNHLQNRLIHQFGKVE